MKQLHGKSKNNLGSGSHSSSNNNNTSNTNTNGHTPQQSQKLDASKNDNTTLNTTTSTTTTAVIENKFRCKVLPEHFTGAIPFVRVNNVLNYDWFVWMPNNINAGDTFVFFITTNDLNRAQYLHQQSISSTLTPTEQLNYNTKIVNEICQEILPNTRPTQKQQERILQALHPYIPIISNSVIESRNGVICPTFHQQYGPLATNGTGNYDTTYITKIMTFVRQFKIDMDRAIQEIYYKEIPFLYREIYVVDRNRFLCLMIGFTCTAIIGFLLSLQVQKIRMTNQNENNHNEQCIYS